MKRLKFILGSRTLLLFVFFIVVFESAGALDIAEKKPVVCTVTINSSDEKEVFKSYLGEEFDFVELTDFAKQGAGDWFLSACKEDIECDILVVSGHFGGSFFSYTGSGYSLSLSELQRRSCQKTCDGILKRPKEVFLFGCNTTAGKDHDDRTPEEYTSDLISSGFSRGQAERVSAFRYSPIGEETKERFQQVFPHSRIYGFHSKAPIGSHIVSRLNRYFESIPSYKSHLEAFPTEDENLLWSSAMKGQWIRSVNGDGGIENPVCVLEEDKPLYKKLDWVNKVLSDEEKSLVYIPVIDEYLKDWERRFGEGSWENFPSLELSVMESIQFNERGREKVEELLSSPIDGVLSAQIQVLNFGRRVAWYDEILYQERLSLLLRDIFKENLDLGQQDLVCSLNVEIDLKLEDLPGEAWNRYTLNAIGCVKPKDIRIHQVLLSVLREGSNSDRNSAAWALGKIGSKEPEVISGLLSALKDLNLDVRNSAVWALSKIGSKEPEVRLSLVFVLKDQDSDPAVRASVARALGRIGSKEPEVIQALVSALKDSDPAVRSSATRALGIIGSKEPEVISGLVSALKDPAPDVRNLAAWALERIGSKEPEVIQALVSALEYPKESNPDVRASVARALGRIGSKESEVISGLVSALKDPDPAVRHSAVWALRRIGSKEPEVRLSLVSVLKDQDSVPAVRALTAEILGRIGSKESEVISGLLSALKDDPAPSVRDSAAKALGRIGSKEPEVIQALVSVLKDQDSDPAVRRSAAWALGWIGSKEPEVIQALVSVLKDQDSDPAVRSSAAWALGKIDSKEPEVIQALVSALKDDPDSDVRSSAAWALGWIGSKEPEVISGLLSALKDDPAPSVRDSAKRALKVIGYTE